MNVDTATYDDLKAHYVELLNATITIEPDPDPSFLEISGFPHYEDVISNWYAFFFNTTGPHGLKSLFIDSLVELVNETGKLSEIPPFDKCSVMRELTVSDKSIDLLLYDEADSKDQATTYKNAIVVENKINALLYNDLSHYYDRITAEYTKTGVVLSLQLHTDIPSTYVNILHKDLIERITKNVGKHMLRADSKYLLLLKDFVQQIQTFSKTDSMKQYVSFYFEHAEKINELNQIKGKAEEALLNDLYMAFEGTPFKWGRRYPQSLNIRYEPHHTY